MRVIAITLNAVAAFWNPIPALLPVSIALLVYYAFRGPFPSKEMAP